MAGLARYLIQLKNAFTGESIISAGGTLYVATANDASKATLKNADGSSLTNPVTATRGRFEFYVADTVNTVDLYGISPTGHAFKLKGVVPSGANEIAIDVNDRVTNLVIPFAIGDTAAATETDTGFDLPASAMVTPDVSVTVLTADSGITIEVGTKAAESGGDADGFVDALSVATAILAKPVFSGTPTVGALLVQNFGTTPAVNIGQQYSSDANTAKSIVYTLSSGADTAEGFINLELLLLAA